ncbi:hypothetical protein C1634_022935 [Chryseobacterium viscerum]|uniref:Uncharacterized protein n=1 Tax=Chryseobacterium viscerum TaxID=1037377 RepID=A0A316WIY7_9FLAO|nr:hypothetical protein C1634_022935 [Chryseobacterium viscerum]
MVTAEKNLFGYPGSEIPEPPQKIFQAFINALSYCFQGIDYSFPCACLNGDPHRKSQKPHKMQMQFIEILILIYSLGINHLIRCWYKSSHRC